MGIFLAFAAAILVLYLLEVHWCPPAASHEGESGMGGAGRFDPVSGKEFFGRLLPLFLGAAACPMVFKSAVAGVSMAVAALVLLLAFGTKRD